MAHTLNLLSAAQSPGELLISIILFGVVIAIGFGAKAMLQHHRGQSLSRVARQLGFSFAPICDSWEFEAFRDLPLFYQTRDEADRTWQNRLQGNLGGLPVSIFEYTYRRRIPFNTKRHLVRHTVMCFELGSLGLPIFWLYPSSSMPFFGTDSSRALTFAGHPRFSSMYVLQGPNEAAIRAQFNHQLLSFFENNAVLWLRNRTIPEQLQSLIGATLDYTLTIQARGNVLMICVGANFISPTQVREFASRGLEIVNQFRAQR